MIILTFVYSSTCFGRFPAHHQELNDCSGSLWFYLSIVEIVVLCSWTGWPDRPRTQHDYHHHHQMYKIYLETNKCTLVLRMQFCGTVVTNIFRRLTWPFPGLSGPWPPSQDASIHLYLQLFSSILLSPAVVVHPSEPHPPI